MISNKALLCFCLVFLISSSSASLFQPSFLPKFPDLLKGVLPAQTNQPFPQYVAALGYPCETHNITTEDGYINTYFRIQAKNSASIKSGLPVVYLQHGLLDSSDTWIVNVEDQAPAFILANKGFDVWVGNTRGNTYSLGQKQTNSSNASSAYWDFSWQEISLYDLPAAFEYIYGATQKQITYIGHSQGTSIMFAALCRHDPVVLKYLKHYIALAPVVYVDNVGSPVVKLIGSSSLGKIMQVLNQKEFLMLPHSVHQVLALVCEFADAACVTQLRLISDTKPEFDNVDRMDVVLGHFPAGTSLQNMLYWNQMLVSKDFKMYDFGKDGNMKHYGTQTPPVYNLGDINVPVYLFAGKYDELAYPNSTATVRDQLTGSPKVFYQEYDLGHASFVWGKNVTGYFKDVLDIINS